MFGIYLLAFGCIILAPVYAVRQSFLSYNLLKQTYSYLASNVFNMNVDLENSKENVEQPDDPLSWWQEMKKNFLNIVTVIVAAKRECLDPSPHHRKSRGRLRRNRLSTLLFVALVAGIGQESQAINLDAGLNPYSESGIDSSWLDDQLGLSRWRIVYPLVIAPRTTVKGLYKVSREW